jgi:hypothetical protein
MTTLTPIVVLAALMAGEPASASTSTPDGMSDQDADAAAVRGELEGMRWLIFGDDDVEGANDRPFEQVVPARRPAKSGSMLHVRTHFLPELIRHSFDL